MDCSNLHIDYKNMKTLVFFISKNIIEAHGSKMWAGNNRDNKDRKRIGATFRFSLPVSKENRRT
jgi:signal transduction histidine kinase